MYVFLLSPNGPLSKRSLRIVTKIMSIQENRATPYGVIVREEGSGGIAVSMAVQSLQRRISSACLYNNRKVPSVDLVATGFSWQCPDSSIISISIAGAYKVYSDSARGISARLGKIGR